MAPNLSFSAQNCNSLNLSTNCEKHVKKISAIVTLGTCLIFLSDIRLGNKCAKADVERSFGCNKIKNYKFFHNSSKNKRGVGILIDMNYNMNVLDSYSDQDENILGLKLEYNEFVFWAISIYGPNSNENNFYDNLRRLVSGAGTGNVPCIIGGDWNATVCTLNSADNIDILNMHSPPSTYRSLRIDEISQAEKLTDPFRASWPTGKISPTSRAPGEETGHV
jgi:exonuclease III